MGKIIQLDNLLSNKIAAGEVVERPASVVKELVENAIDANSTRIEIIIEEAGMSKIQIIDDGDGIEEADCLLAFSRHATSKIKDEHDLFRIRTLGFRGEALPSIASISELEIKTSTGEGPGTYLFLRGGEVAKKEACNSRKGTDISVQNIFFNTPARLKHLKTIHTELGNISDVINRIALSHPNISFRFLHNGKELLHTVGNGDVKQVIASIYGLAVAKKMIPIELSSLDFQIKGFIGLPEINRASRNYISTMINGRFIKNYSIWKAIQQGYHTLLPIGRYPICICMIEMDPILVDVNVHPSKLEVRLSKEKELVELLEEGIKKAFRKEQLIPEMNNKAKRESAQEEQQSFPLSYTRKEPKPLIKSETSFPSTVREREEERKDTEESAFILREQPKDISSVSTQTVVLEEEIDNEIDIQEEMETETDRIPPLYPIGQMHGTYIIAQNEKGLFLIDQHAAQERVKYEFYREKVGEIANEVQELLVPITLEFTFQEKVMLEENMEELKKVGVFLEEFGPQSYIIRSHPQWFPKGYEKEILEDIINQLLEQKKVDIKALREDAAIMMSCKGSIKANHHLRNDEIFALLESLRGSTDPFTCPHGRPIIVHLSTYEIEKMFKRIM